MLYAILGLGALGFVFGVSLSLASKKFFVKLDPREEAVIKVLPGTNCGACGFPGCAGLARAIIKGDAPANACTSGGADVTKNVSHIMYGTTWHSCVRAPRSPVYPPSPCPAHRLGCQSGVPSR